MNVRSVLEDFEEILKEYGFPQEQVQALREHVRFLDEHPHLYELADAYYDKIFDPSDPYVKPTRLCEADDEESGMLFSVIYLARFCVFGDVLANMGIPRDYVRQSVWHFQELFRRNFVRYGSYGFRGLYRDAMQEYFFPRRFTLGRLNFEVGRFHAPYGIYQNQLDGTCIPIAKEGICYLESGKQRPRKSEEPFALQTTKTETEDALRGYTFDALGRLIFEPQTYPKSLYRSFLSEGDDVVNVHIPGNGEPFSPSAVTESFRQAKEFFARYYPHKQFRAFVCSSWLLDTSLRAYLRPDSNILAFQNRFRIVLSHTNPTALYFDIFPTEAIVPISELIPRNRFQQCILDHIKQYGHIYSGNGYILYSDAP